MIHFGRLPRFRRLPGFIRERLVIRARDMLAAYLKREGFDAFVPEEVRRKPHLDIHIAAKDKKDAARIAKELQIIYMMKLKKRFANGTHHLFVPNVFAVVVNPKR